MEMHQGASDTWSGIMMRAAERKEALKISIAVHLGNLLISDLIS